MNVSEVEALCPILIDVSISGFVSITFITFFFGYPFTFTKCSRRTRCSESVPCTKELSVVLFPQPVFPIQMTRSLFLTASNFGNILVSTEIKFGKVGMSWLMPSLPNSSISSPVFCDSFGVSYGVIMTESVYL